MDLMTSGIIVQGVAETEEFRRVREMFAKDACSAMMRKSSGTAKLTSTESSVSGRTWDTCNVLNVAFFFLLDLFVGVELIASAP